MTDNELDAAAAAMLSPQPPEDRAAAARFGYMAAADTNPDVYAEAQRIARRTGVPTLTALNVPAVKKQAVMGEIPFEAIARDAPTTALMLADMEASKVIHDDIGNLTGVEKALRVLGNTGSAVLSAGPKFNEGAWGLVRAAGELMGAPGRPIVESATRLGQTARGQADSLMPKAGNVWEAGLYSGAQSFGVNLLQLPLALVPGGSAAAGARMSPVLWSMGANTGGQAFAEARDKGVPLTQALAFGASQGVIEAGTEMLGMPALFSLLKPGKFGAKALEYMVKEQGGEQIATAMQDLNEWAVLPENANKTFGDYLAARPNAALQTAIATAVGGGAQVATVKAAGWAVNRAEYQAAKAQQAEQSAQVLTELNTLAQANKVLQRSPETFQEFVAKAAEDGPLQSVYIDGQTLMQSGLAEQVAAVSPAVAEQVQQAAQTGGAVAIPVDEYAARIAPTDLAQQLQPHLRTEADGFSQAEAQQWMDTQGERLQADLDRAVADSQQGDAFRASADAVTGQIRQQLDAAARFRPEVNDAYARVVGAYYATRAAQLGVTPQELFAQRRLRIGSQQLNGLQFDQGQNDQTDDVDEATGLPLNADGTVTVYHHTSAEKAAKIRQTGFLRSAGEPDLYFTTRADTDTGYGDTAIAVRVKPERLALDDEFPGGRADFRVAAPSRVRRLRFLPDGSAVLNQSASQDGAVALRALADEGNNQAIVAQALVDRAGFGPKQFADVLEGAALGAQPDGLVGVPAFAAMLSHMRSAVLDDLKVLDAIVGSVPVDMVNNLAGSESAAKVLLHDEAMNEDSPAFNADLMVANGVDTSNPVGLLVREAALAAAKVASVTLNNGRESSEAGAAILAGDGNSFSQSARLPRAAFHPSTNTITLLDNADLTSFLHESAHFFFENDIALASEIVAAQREGASIKPGEQQLLADVGQLLTWHGLKGDVAAQLTEWHNMPFEEKRALHERTAESFEAYLFEGKAPSIELAPYFQRFRSWLLSVYRSLKDFLAGHPEAGTLTPEVRAVFDRMLATNEAILMAEQGRSMLALFETAAQAGMSPEAWAAYQAQGNQATQDAVQDLQARGLRDLQWLKGARSRMLKKLQGEAKAARDAAAVDVRREVMAEPVYRAWRFLTGRLQDEDRIGEPPAPPKPGAGLNREVDSLLTAIAKLGGISRASAAEHLGVHADDFRRNSGVFGKRLFLKEGGLSADAMAELLLSEGYLRADENGLADLRELEELVAGELGGAPHYSPFRDPSLAFEEARAGDQVQDPSQLGAGRLDVASLREMYGRNAALENAIPTRRAATFEEAAEKAGAFIGKELTNKATKKTATVSKGTLRKMLSASAARKSVSAADHALAVANVDKLFAAAVLDHSHADARGEPTIVAIHRFMAPMIGGDGNVLLVKLTVKETKGEGEPNPLYSVEALDVKKPTREAPVETGIERVPGTENGVAEHPTGGLSSSVARRLAEVNDAASRTPEWQRLTSHGMTATKGALHPDVAADILGGFDSGDALVQALLAATPLDEEIEARIDQRMLEQHGELATPEALEAAADAAIHSEARGRMVATELAALTKATGAPKVLADAARQFAAAAIARLKVRNLTPSMFSNAQAKAARNAAAALKKGDLALAAAEKRNEILQHYSAKAAHEARDEIERGRKYLAGFDGDVKGLDAGYLDQIAALLERFDLRKGTSLRAADKRKSLAAWLEAQREAGMEPDVPAELQNEAFTKSYKDMTVEEFRGLRDTVKQIEHLGRLKHKLLTAADQRAFDAVRDEIAASIGQHANGAAPEQSTPATDAGARKLKAHQFFLSHLKVANIAQRMDGGETGGPVWTFFARSAQERANWKAAKQAELTGKLMEIMRPVLARAGQFRTARARPALGISLTQEQVFALALNMGNEGNISRLLTGGINGRHFSHGQLVQLIDDELTAADLAAVQAIWDLMAELTPEAQAKHKRLYGREMELVAPTPLVTKHGTLRGGYYPIVYDPRGSVRVGENEADAVAKDALRAAHTAATTRRSYTKARLDETPYPLILTMGGVHRGLSQVVHDLAWHEWSMDVGRMLRDKTFQAAVLETYGLDYLKALQGWHEDIVTENVREQAGWERFGVHLRASVPAAAMGYSLLTAIQQPIGLTQSMARLGSGAVFKALAGFVGSPRAKITKARELSAFMRSRGITRFREVADLKRQIDLTGNRLRQAHSAVAEHAFDLLGWVQTCVDVPTWHAAFEKATAEGKDQATAVAVADQAVIDTQGDGAIQNLSGVQRDRFGKWLTLFYSYLSGALNMIWQTAHSERSLPRKTADILMLTMVPATLTALIKWAVKPGDDDDDEKYWKLVQQIMKENISLPLSMFVGIRELSDQAASLMVGEPVFSYQGPGSFRVVAETAKLLGQVSQGELDAGLGRSVINVAGSVTGLPSTQINRTIQGAQALADGETQNPAAVAFGFQKPR